MVSVNGEQDRGLNNFSIFEVYKKSYEVYCY